MLNSITNSLLKPLTQPAAVKANAHSAVAAAAQQPPASDSSSRPGFGFDLSPQALQQLASLPDVSQPDGATATVAQNATAADTIPAAMSASSDEGAAPAAAAAYGRGPAAAVAEQRPASQLQKDALIELPEDSGLDLESARAWAIESLKRERLGELVLRLQTASPSASSADDAPAVGGQQAKEG